MWILLAMFIASAALADVQRSAQLSPAVRAILDSDQEISLVVVPHEGDAWTRLAKRVTGDAAAWKEIAALNGLGANLPANRSVRVPLAMLRPDLRRETIRALFPDDVETAEGWKHKISAGGVLEGESLWKVAEWFTGDGANYAAIRAANPAQTLSTRRGDWILIPRAVLSEAFAPPTTTAQIAEDDPVQREEEKRGGGEEGRRVASSPVPLFSSSSLPLVSSSSTNALEYQKSVDRPYAVYRLRKDEAIYSSVVIRFTGRVFARDVNEAVDQVIAFNAIENVSRLPVGYPVRIPMELLAPEHRPPNDPRRVEYERARAESSRLARRVRAARNLVGVHVIIDAGHGGRDVGTVQQGLWESNYVYDVACRLKKALETKSAARVSMTTRSLGSGYAISQKNEVPRLSDHIVLTTPRYALDDSVVGVNLRWYLANSVFRKALRDSVPSEKVVFISIHADSLHPSLRGAMTYVPGNRFVKGSYKKTQPVYLARAEVRENPTVTQTEEEALRAEGLSTELADSILESFQSSQLEIHPFSPIRSHVVRDGKEWVPAIIRYNKVPSRLLLEICNLGNAEDRALLKKRSYRDQVAGAIYDGIVNHFVAKADPAPGQVVSSQ